MNSTNLVFKVLRPVVSILLVIPAWSFAAALPIEKALPAVVARGEVLALTLDRPLASGEREIDFQRLGVVVDEILKHRSPLSPDDVATITSAVLGNFALTEFAEDKRVMAFFGANLDRMNRLDLGDLATDLNASAVWTIRCAHLAMLLRQAHFAHSMAPDEAVRDAVAKWLFRWVARTQFYQGVRHKSPSDDEIVQLLEKVANHPDASAETRDVWRRFVDLLESDLATSQATARDRRETQQKLNYEFVGAVGTGMVTAGVVAALSPIIEPKAVQTALAFSFFTVFGGQFLGQSIFEFLVKPKSVAAEQHKTDAFIDACDQRLAYVSSN